MSSLIGHNQLRVSLAALVDEDRLPGSLLFSGTAGVGKRLVAQELAARLLCNTPPTDKTGGCGTCSPCRLVRSGNHPDLRSIECAGEDMSVDLLRETLERLSLRPFMGKLKVTILDDADLISTIGANILLKTLEEPRSEDRFILIASTPSRLPQTVLSRCQRWFFDRLSTNEMEAALRERGASEEEMKLIPFADGSLGALESVKTKQACGDDVLDVIDAAWRGDTARVIHASQDWGSDKAGLRERIAFVRGTIRHKLFESRRNTDAAAVWATALQNVIDIEYLILERHTNPTLAWLQLLMSCSQTRASGYTLTPNSYPTILEKMM